MAYVTRNGVRRQRGKGVTNGIQYCVSLTGYIAVFECKRAGHRSTKDFTPKRGRGMALEMLQKMAKYWGLGTQPNGTRGHCYGWCQKCQNEHDGVPPTTRQWKPATQER